MIREAEYNALMKRLDAPENAPLKRQLTSVPDGYNLTFHLKRIEEYAKNRSNTTNLNTRQLLELDYSVSLSKAHILMDELGWK